MRGVIWCEGILVLESLRKADDDGEASHVYSGCIYKNECEIV